MDLDVARIEKAVQMIDPVFLNTPQYFDERLCRALEDRAVTVKLEAVNPVRSFKGRGADLMLSTLAPGTPVVCASSGDFGQAIAYTGRTRGMPVEGPPRYWRACASAARSASNALAPSPTASRCAARRRSRCGGARALVDEITLVTDEAIVAAMELAARTLGIVLEPAGAAGLAAIAEGAVAGDRLATVLAGADPRPEQAWNCGGRASRSRADELRRRGQE